MRKRLVGSVLVVGAVLVVPASALTPAVAATDAAHGFTLGIPLGAGGPGSLPGTPLPDGTTMLPGASTTLPAAGGAMSGGGALPNASLALPQGGGEGGGGAPSTLPATGSSGVGAALPGGSLAIGTPGGGPAVAQGSTGTQGATGTHGSTGTQSVPEGSTGLPQGQGSSTSTAPAAGPTTLPQSPPSTTTSTRPPVSTATTPVPTTTTTRPVGSSTAAVTLKWGKPARVDNFDAAPGAGWTASGPTATVRAGVLTLAGDSKATPAALRWSAGSRYGRWEARVRMPAGDAAYSPAIVLVADPPGAGQIDVVRATDAARQKIAVVLHHGTPDVPTGATAAYDATAWHNWAVEWTATGLTFYVDGVEWWKTTDTASFPSGTTHLELRLDATPPAETSASTLGVDWVAYYPVDGSGKAAPPVDAPA